MSFDTVTYDLEVIIQDISTDVGMDAFVCLSFIVLELDPFMRIQLHEGAGE